MLLSLIELSVEQLISLSNMPISGFYLTVRQNHFSFESGFLQRHLAAADLLGAGDQS